MATKTATVLLVLVQAASTLADGGLAAGTAASLLHGTDGSLNLAMNLVPQTAYPHARCMDGTPPGYYWRAGKRQQAKSLVLFLEGGGWCYPSDIQQPCSPKSSHCTANCHIRAASDHGSSVNYTKTMPVGGVEGGTGYLSGNASKTRFADFAVAYARYCDGGSFSGTKTTPDVALNGTKPLYYAGKHNLDGVLGDLVSKHGVGEFEHVVLSGCSAGGMACFLHCDYVASWFKKNVQRAVDVRCICDAGLFIDIPTVTGAGNVMRQRFYDLADRMATKASLSPRCVASEADWRECMFAETSLKYTSTPLFTMNSMYNFGEWEMLAPITKQSFPPDTTAPPPDWAACWPGTGGLTAASLKLCNATQLKIIAARLATFKKKLAPATSPGTPHGAWLSSCPSMHCQSGFSTSVLVNGTTVGDAAGRWWFDKSVEKHVDADFPMNPTCPKSALKTEDGAHTSGHGDVTVHVSPHGRAGEHTSLESARDFLRALPPGSSNAPRTVVVHAGRYELDAPLLLDQRDSHTTWRAHAGAAPVHSGGKKLSGSWTPPAAKGAPWRLALAGPMAAVNFKQLFVGGERATRAREPERGSFYQFVGLLPAPHANTGFMYRGKELDALQGHEAEGLEIVVYASWMAARRNVRAINASAHTVMLTAGARILLEPYANSGSRYYAENFAAACDSPGEWFLDSAACSPPGECAELLWQPRHAGEDPRTLEFIAPSIEGELLMLNNTQNVEIEGMTFEHADWSLTPTNTSSGSVQGASFLTHPAVHLRNSSGCTFTDVTVQRVGEYGIWMEGGSAHNSFVGSMTRDTGAGAIRLGRGKPLCPDSGPGSGPDGSDFNSITDCTFVDGMHVYHEGQGILVQKASHTTMTRNEVAYFQTGISVGWTWDYRPSEANHNVVLYNHVHHLGNGELSDLAAIYLLGISPGTVVKGNHVRDSYPYFQYGHGIYLDQAAADVTVEGNLAYHTEGGTCYQHYGTRNAVTNNIFGLATGGTGIVWQHANGMARGDQLSDLEFHRNIVLVDERVGEIGLFGSTWLGNSSFRSNIYWNASGAVSPLWPSFVNGTHCKGWRNWSKTDGCSLSGSGGVTDRSFEQWRATGQDKSSLIADPEFAKKAPAQAADFKLSAKSPALKLGFDPSLVTAIADPSAVGPAAKFKRDWSLPGCPPARGKAVTCGAPGTPANGSLSGNGVWRCGDVAVWHCNPGFLLTGATYAYCRASGWSDPAATCVPLPSQAPAKCLGTFGGKGISTHLVSKASSSASNELLSPDASHDVIMRPDGNLCIYTNIGGFPTQTWCSKSKQKKSAPAYQLSLQGDGNLCVYPGGASHAFSSIWCSGSSGCAKPPCSFWAGLSNAGVLCVHEGMQCVDNAPSAGAKWCSNGVLKADDESLSPPPPPATFPLYDPLPATGVTFNTSDSALQGLFDKGATAEVGNAQPFMILKDKTVFKVMEEGSHYKGAWIETQPMAGGMYASRSVRVALNNQLVFVRAQRKDGRLPHRVDPCRGGKSPNATTCSHLHPGWSVDLQGIYMATPAVDVAYFMQLQKGNKSAEYLQELYLSLAGYDNYLWTTRNDSTCVGLHSNQIVPHNCPATPSAGAANKRGLLWSNGTGDTGEDGTTKFCRKKVKGKWTQCESTVLSMDMAGYTYDLRRALARICMFMKNPTCERIWVAKATKIAAIIKTGLWRESKAAMYDRYSDDSWVSTLQHNNIRMMWLGAFDQSMADAFVAKHLMNTSEFWTKCPLPSISASDPHFADLRGNNWSGPPEGLTFQRAIRALESYGHFAESILAGLALTSALLSTKGCRTDATLCQFPQQIDPFTALPEPGEGYGPMIMSLLEHTARRVGIVLEPNSTSTGGALLFSSAFLSAAKTIYTQTLGSQRFTLDSSCDGATVGVLAVLGGKPLFATSCTASDGAGGSPIVGVRVVTTLQGAVSAIVGIANATQSCKLTVGVASTMLTVKPNEQWRVVLADGKLTASLSKATPFTRPFKSDDEVFPNNCTVCFPTLLPKWKPVWKLDRSTIAMPCNYSGWMDPELMASFGFVFFDWANHENSWRSRASEIVPAANDTQCALPHLPSGSACVASQKKGASCCFYPDEEDLITQVQKVKAINPATRTCVYRQGQGAGSPSGKQAQKLLSDPSYDGFFLKSAGCPPSNSSCGALPRGMRVGPFDFRNETLQSFFADEYVNGATCAGNPQVDGYYTDDVTGIGSPGTPDATPALKQSGMSLAEAADWNAGQRVAVIAGQTKAVNENNAFSWQLLQPMSDTGGVGMVSPTKASCLLGGKDMHTGKGFPGLRKLCAAGSAGVRNLPLFQTLWSDRNEMSKALGHGSCTEKADCARDTCRQLDPRGGVDCAPLSNIRERIASFQLIRGDYAWLGYSWQGCAGTDHRRPYDVFPGGPYVCPQNASLKCSGYTDGARWQPPKLWDPQGAMALDFGGDQKPVEKACREVKPGVFERKFAKITVRLDCNSFESSFVAADNAPAEGGGYGGLGNSVKSDIA